MLMCILLFVAVGDKDDDDDEEEEEDVYYDDDAEQKRFIITTEINPDILTCVQVERICYRPVHRGLHNTIQSVCPCVSRISLSTN